MATLAEKVKGQGLFTLNNVPYFGTITEASEGVDAKVEITQAVKVTSDDFTKTVKDWVKAENSGTLKSPKVSGMYTLEESELTEDQIMIIDIVCSRAEYIKKNVLKNLQNAEIDGISV